MSQAIDSLILLAQPHAKPDQTATTKVPFLSVTHRSRPNAVTRSILTPSFCLVLRGTKRIHIGKDVITYRAGNFLAATIDVPAAGHVAAATPANPYLGLRIDLETKEIAALVSEAKIKVPPRADLTTAAFVGKTDIELLQIFEKLLRLLETPDSIPYLSAIIKKELIYRLLTGDYGHLFYQRAIFEHKADNVGKVISWIRDNFASPFTVEDLAKANGMSVSALHHKFKKITTMSPLQYQKQLRLQEARRLLLAGESDATTAALEVGYESPSQFSREYRRLFGKPPLQDVRALGKDVQLKMD